MTLRVHPTELPWKTLQSSVSKFFTPYPTKQEIQWDGFERLKTSLTTLPRSAKRYNVHKVRFFFIWSKMSAEQNCCEDEK